MEPLNATADVKSDRAEIWVGCRNPLGFRRDVAAILDMDPEQVTLHNHMMGGGFGQRPGLITLCRWRCCLAQLAVRSS